MNDIGWGGSLIFFHSCQSQAKMSGGFEGYEDVLDANIIETMSKLSDARDIDNSPVQAQHELI